MAFARIWRIDLAMSGAASEAVATEEQRLKKMVVRPIEKGHLETLVIGELARALKSRESAPDDEHLSRCGMLAGDAWSLASFSLNGKPCL